MGQKQLQKSSQYLWLISSAKSKTMKWVLWGSKIRHTLKESRLLSLKIKESIWEVNKHSTIRVIQDTQFTKMKTRRRVRGTKERTSTFMRCAHLMHQLIIRLLQLCNMSIWGLTSLKTICIIIIEELTYRDLNSVQMNQQASIRWLWRLRNPIFCESDDLKRELWVLQSLVTLSQIYLISIIGCQVAPSSRI